MLQGDQGLQICRGNPFQVLEDLLGTLELPEETPLPPLAAGGLGFLAYDLKNHLENLPQTALDDLNLPDLVLAFPRRLVVHDRRGGRFWQVGVTYEDPQGRRHSPGGGRNLAPGRAPGGLPGGPASEQLYPGGLS